MNLAKIELGKKDSIIATITTENTAMKKESAAKDKEIAELRRRLGLN